jgi:4-amino-4-deoxy-L-arabinose transferase-like glycosyltransferase
MSSKTAPAPAFAGRLGGAALCTGLLSAAAAFHLWYLLSDCPLDLSGDEAHYWEWSRRLDLCYYSKGPLVAYLIAAGRVALADCSIRLLGNEVLAVRVPAILLSILTGLGIYRLALAAARSAKAAVAAVALTFTIPLLAAGSMLMTIDAPLACAWVWALAAAEKALRQDCLRSWLAVGLLTGLGILAKYTMVLIFPVLLLTVLLRPTLRRRLRRAGPYLAVALSLMALLPITFWNARHDWVSFRHVAGQAGLAGSTRFNAQGVLAYLGGQLGVLGIFWPLGMVAALLELRPHKQRQPAPSGDFDAEGPGSDPDATVLLWSAAALPWAVFLLFSPITKVQPNWPMPAVIPGTILLTQWLRRRAISTDPKQRRFARHLVLAGALTGAAIVVAGHRTELLAPMFDWLARGTPPMHLVRPAPPWDPTPIARFDPTARLRGWRELGAAVGEVLSQEKAKGRQPFILADEYQLASLLAFYTPGQPVVYCVQSAVGGRRSQYDLWPNPIDHKEQFLGRPCIYVGALHIEVTGAPGGPRPALPGLRPERRVEYRLAGRPLKYWTVYVCEAFAGFEGGRAAAKGRF